MWVLLFVVATSDSYQTGAASIQQEFASKDRCTAAQSALAEQSNARGNFVLTSICVPK